MDEKVIKTIVEADADGLADILKQKGVDFFAQALGWTHPKTGATLLHLAVHQNNLSLFKLLSYLSEELGLESWVSKAMTETTTKKGFTALHLMVLSQNVQLLKYMQEAYFPGLADAVGQSNVDRLSPRALAMLLYGHDDEQCLPYLGGGCNCCDGSCVKRANLAEWKIIMRDETKWW